MRLGDVMVVMLGAGLGGGARYAICGWITHRWGSSLPWHTLAVNITGAFLIGVLASISIDRELLPETWRIFLTAGVLGGYTTFSTLSYESIVLFERGLGVHAAANMFGSGAAGLVAVVLGLAAGRLL